MTFPPLTARAWAAAVWPLGRLIAALAGASNNVEGGLRTSEGISRGTDRDGWGFKEVVWASLLVFKGDGGYPASSSRFSLRYLLGINVVSPDSGAPSVGISGD